ncbi:hypothetical protein ABPG74_004977 [Tetrahymena malaccensis]
MSQSFIYFILAFVQYLLQYANCYLETNDYIVFNEINAILHVNQQNQLCFSYFTVGGDFGKPYVLQYDLSQQQQLKFSTYFMIGSKIYIRKTLFYSYAVIDLEAIQKNDNPNFISDQEIQSIHNFCPQQGEMFKLGQYFYLICAKSGSVNVFKDTNLENITNPSSQINDIQTTICTFNYYYAHCSVSLFYKDKIFNLLTDQMPFKIIDFDLDIFLTEAIELIRLDLNQSVITFKAYIQVPVCTFISQVVKLIGMNVIVAGVGNIGYAFYNVDTFKIISDYIQYPRQFDLSYTFIIENHILCLDNHQVLHVKMNYNSAKKSIEFHRLQTDYSSLPYYSPSPFQFQYIDYFQKVMGKIKNVGHFFTPNIYELVPICTDFCIKCGSYPNYKCQKCQKDYYLQIDQTCSQSCPDQYQYDSIQSICKCDINSTQIGNNCQCNSQFYQNGNQCFPCPVMCKQCINQVKCSKCLSGYYLFPDQSCNYCDSQNGFAIQGNQCLPCHQSCKTCSGSNINQCTKCDINIGFYLFKEQTCITCDTNQGYFIIEDKCYDCYQYCKTCFGINKNECSSCYEGYDLINNSCSQIYLVYESKIFTESKIEEIQQQSQFSSSTLIISSQAINLLQNIGSNSSFGVLTSGLTIQKLSYLYLFNINLPKPVYSALLILSGKLPSQQLLFLNPFSQGYLSTNYQNTKYLKVDLAFHILINCAQAIILFIICSFIFGLFYILIEKVKQEKVKQISIKAYQSVFSSLVVQYFQLILSILIIGINQQVKELIYYSTIEQLPMKQILTLIFTILVIIIFKQQYKYLNQQNSNLSLLNFQDLTMEKIRNDTIYDSKIRLNFMLIYQFFESFLLPTTYLQLSENWLAANIVSIIIQLSLLIVIIYLRPFFCKITNWYFIINHLFWLLLQIQFMVLNFYCEKTNVMDFIQNIELISITFLINMQIVQFIQPLYMIITLSIQIYDLIKKQMLKKTLQQQEDLMQQNTFSSQNSSNVEIELIKKEKKSLQIVDIFKKKKQADRFTEQISQQKLCEVDEKEN